MEQLKGKTALITGGSRGIGRAIALALAKEGVNIAVTGRTEPDLKKVLQEIKEFDVKGCYAIANVGSLEEVNKAVDKIRGELGDIDILVNNAGISSFGGFLVLEP